MPKDDDREVGWAPRKIRELQRQVKELREELAGTDRAVASINDREVADVRGLNDRLIAVETALSNYGVLVAPARNGGLFEDPEYSPPIGGRKLIGPAHAHLDAPCTEACYEPVGGVVRADVTGDEMRARITGAAAMRQEAYERGTSNGFSEGIVQAELRVRKYLTDRAFSEETVDELTACVRDTQASSN